jgi:hypothetical protein
MKRVTFRITATVHDYVDKKLAKLLMINALSHEGELTDPYVQVMQIDEIEEPKKDKNT